MLSLDELRADVESGAVDTVIACFTDMQGRLMGKRLDAEFFLDENEAGHPGRGLQLPARARDGDGPGAGVRDRELGARLRRLRAPARPLHPAPDPLARGHRDGAVRRRVARRDARRPVAAPGAEGAGREGARAGLRADVRLGARVLPLPRDLRSRRTRSTTTTSRRRCRTSSTTTSSRRASTSRSCARCARR